MSKHLERELDRLKQRILALGAQAEESVRKAVQALAKRRPEQAEEVIRNDAEIDSAEVELEEECLKILALHQPVAIDLRFIVAVLKINSDLERIGDLAVNIAERALYVATHDETEWPFDFTTMSRRAQAMLRQSLDALVNMDPDLARNVCAQDDEVDAINRDMYLGVQKAIREHPEHLASLIHLLSTSRHLERIADHATNIAEDVVYMVEGEIMRHRTEDYRKAAGPQEQAEG